MAVAAILAAGAWTASAHPVEADSAGNRLYVLIRNLDLPSAVVVDAAEVALPSFGFAPSTLYAPPIVPAGTARLAAFEFDVAPGALGQSGTALVSVVGAIDGDPIEILIGVPLDVVADAPQPILEVGGTPIVDLLPDQTVDSDSDGHADWVEQLYGSDPNNPVSAPGAIPVPSLGPVGSVPLALVLAIGAGMWLARADRRRMGLPVLLVLLVAPTETAHSGERTSIRALGSVCKPDIDVGFSEDAVEDVEGVFVRPNLTTVTGTNFAESKFLMRPFTVRAKPLGGLLTLSVTGSSIEIWKSDGTQLTLPATTINPQNDLLINGVGIGISTIEVAYEKGPAKCRADLLVRVNLFPGLASEPLTKFPHVEYVRAINAGASLLTSLDPARHPERVGRRYAVYVVDHKTAAEYAVDATLVDVTGKSLGDRTFDVDGAGIAENLQPVWDAAIALPTPYDIVFDFGNDAESPADFVADGRFDPGDIIGQLTLSPDVGELGVLADAGEVLVGTPASASYAPVGADVVIPAGYDALPMEITQPIRGRFVHPPAPVPAGTPLVAIAHGNHAPYRVRVTGITRPPYADRDGWVGGVFAQDAAIDGELWTSTYGSELHAVDFHDENLGWAVGDDGLMLHSFDGGDSWAQQYTPTAKDLRDVDFVSATKGWAVGAGGTILHTSDGGATWVLQASGTTDDLEGVKFSGTGQGWAVGAGGRIVYKEDDVTAWVTQTNPSNAALQAIDVIDDGGTQRGWAVGSSGVIVSTSNGGSTWSPQNSGTPVALNDVDFVDGTHGWAVGDGGVVRKTSDGGVTWIGVSSGTSQRLNSVSFVDILKGWVAGDAGQARVTIDGGAKWGMAGTGTVKDLLDIRFLDVSVGWAVGIEGTTAKTTNGGAAWNVRATPGIWATTGSVTGPQGTVAESGGVWLIDVDGHFGAAFAQGTAGKEWQHGDQITVAFGQGGDPVAPNYDGYQDLQEQLALRGYASLSVDLDSLAFETSIRARGWVLLNHIHRALTNPDVSGAAFGHLDADRMILVGHSRGGEAVLQAYRMLQNPGERPAGGPAFGFDDDSVLGIVSISPTNFEGEASATPSAGGLDKPFLLIYGGADGDVQGTFPSVRPFEHYDRATNEKQVVYVEGVNHNFFNDSWACDDARRGRYATAIATCSDLEPAGIGANLIAAAAVKTLARAYIGAFARLHFGGERAMAELFRRSKARFLPPSVDAEMGGRIRGEYRSGGGTGHVVVDDYETQALATTASSGATVTATPGLIDDDVNAPPQDRELREPDPIPNYAGLFLGVSMPREDGNFDFVIVNQPADVNGDEAETVNRYVQDTKGVVLAWDATPRNYEFEFAVPQDFSMGRVLSFRAANKVTDPTTQRPDIEFTVELEDAAGQKSAVETGIWAQAEGGYVATKDLFTQLASQQVLRIADPDEDEHSTTGVFQTFRFDLAAFTNAGRELDLSRIDKIRFEFGGGAGTHDGRMALDDVEISVE